jgi:hypothetical protein
LTHFIRKVILENDEKLKQPQHRPKGLKQQAMENFESDDNRRLLSFT